MPSKNAIIETSIIVTTWNSFDFTKNCLNSIIENTDLKNCELILVDNGSTDESIEKLEMEFEKKLENFSTIKNKINKGFAYALNQGYAAAKGKYIAYLNNDTVVSKNWLSELRKLLDSDEKIAIAGIKEVSPKQFMDKKLLEEIKSLPNREKLTLPVGWLTRKKMIEELGYLDAEFFSPIYGEEADWNFRAKNSGYKIIECSQSIVMHYGSSDSKKSMPSKKHYYLLNIHRLRSMLFNLNVLDLIKFLPGLSLIFIQSFGEGMAVELLKSYFQNLKDLKLVLMQRKSKRKFVPFKEPKFTKPFEMAKESN